MALRLGERQRMYDACRIGALQPEGEPQLVDVERVEKRLATQRELDRLADVGLAGLEGHRRGFRDAPGLRIPRLEPEQRDPFELRAARLTAAVSRHAQGD